MKSHICCFITTSHFPVMEWEIVAMLGPSEPSRSGATQGHVAHDAAVSAARHDPNPKPWIIKVDLKSDQKVAHSIDVHVKGLLIPWCFLLFEVSKHCVCVCEKSCCFVAINIYHQIF